MDIGLFGVGSGTTASAAGLATILPLVEELGFDSVWAGEHMVAPSPRIAPSPIEPDYPMLDPLAVLTFAAALTQRLLLGTGILLLPQRPPVALAKAVASLDVLSNGRLLLGVGVGYLQPEFAAVGADFQHRGRRTEEYIAAMRALWTMDAPSFDGETVQFSGVDAYPRPVQAGGPPLVMGGHSPGAYRRAVTMSSQWYGFAMDPAGTARCLAGIREAADRYQRPAEYGELVINVTPNRRLSPQLVEEYAALGVHRLLPILGGTDSAGVEESIRANAPQALLR